MAKRDDGIVWDGTTDCIIEGVEHGPHGFHPDDPFLAELSLFERAEFWLTSEAPGCVSWRNETPELANRTRTWVEEARLGPRVRNLQGYKAICEERELIEKSTRLAQEALKEFGDKQEVTT